MHKELNPGRATERTIFISRRARIAALLFRSVLASQPNMSCTSRDAGVSAGSGCGGSLSRINRSYPGRKMNFHPRSLNPFRITARPEFAASYFSVSSDIFKCPTHTYTHTRSPAYIVYNVQNTRSHRLETRERVFQNIRARLAALYPSVSSLMFNYVGDDRRN